MSREKGENEGGYGELARIAQREISIDAPTCVLASPVSSVYLYTSSFIILLAGRLRDKQTAESEL